ncbi:DUF6204 family protein [Nonomuraea pusilla]|uniref:Uncharacterized protein n=1 Tax=Nonomuraea pusilla TaxID=46177 RepID=A0A1H7IY99_9ACTN|nr:DUF6204 family protein [Nonomuraea pusilla]SEK67513.1 hypothetical protein SAMN05660976_00971 [Nonomuraea pusilla]
MFRVVISGAFEELDDAGRAAVLAAGGAAFTEAGTFTHDGTLRSFTFRCQVPAGPQDGEREATERALAALGAHRVPHRVLRVAMTDLRDIKIRRKRR